MSTEEIKAVITECWDALEHLDYERGLACYADDAVHEDLGIMEIAKGKDEVRDFWYAWHDVINNDAHKLTLHSMQVQPDGAYALEWTLRVRVDGNLRGIEGNGRTFEVRGSTIGQVSDGKITLWRDYYNGIPVLAQLGVKEIPGV